MNLQRVTPYKDLPGFDGERIPAVMASFVSLFLRTETVRRYGLPIAEFFIWSDDWEYTRRISRAQPCYVVPASRVVHAHAEPRHREHCRRRSRPVGALPLFLP